MIDSSISLAFSMHANKGVYALLLGSGVSRSAGIPTGWEVVLDLIRKVAHLRNEDCEPDPAAWYKEVFGEEPDYAKLLDALVKTPTERSQLLKGYFEPTEEEREQGLKVPTTAHKAIADLVKSGHIRVIITTNFDRLMERALEAIGITPIVISTPDAVEGTLPLAHTSCSLIKVHGDYLDTRIKNTPGELARYDERLDEVLDRVFDEFGLIVCGWSGEWDTALGAALERCKSRRFTTYWVLRSKAGDAAKRLITLKGAQEIQASGADAFFQALAEKVASLQEMDEPHPLSVKVAVATLKRYLVDDRYRIRLHDLVVDEAERLRSEICGDQFPIQGVQAPPEDLMRRMKGYEALSQISLAVLITGCYWSNTSDQQHLWVQNLERLANVGEQYPVTTLLRLRRYPALLLLYGGGMAALTAGRYDLLLALLTKPIVRNINDEEQPLFLVVNPWDLIESSIAQTLPGLEKRYTPISDHLYEALQHPLLEFISDTKQFLKYFDRFEYFCALIHVDLRLKQSLGVWAPLGCFSWRLHASYKVIEEVAKEAASEGANWAPLTMGLFDGSMERFDLVREALHEFMRQSARR